MCYQDIKSIKRKGVIMDNDMYELTVIAPEDMKRSEQLKLLAEIDRIGRVHKWEKDGVKTLAYPVDEYKRGMFLYYDLRLPTSASRVELTRMLDDADNVVRYLLLKKDTRHIY